jgi:hypothetical protein
MPIGPWVPPLPIIGGTPGLPGTGGRADGRTGAEAVSVGRGGRERDAGRSPLGSGRDGRVVPVGAEGVEGLVEDASLSDLGPLVPSTCCAGVSWVSVEGEGGTS